MAVSVATALNRALRAAKLGPEYAATVALAKRYAAALDEGDPTVLAKLGPQLMVVLEALGMSRRAASAVRSGEVPASGESGQAGSLAELRDRAQRRQAS